MDIVAQLKEEMELADKAWRSQFSGDWYNQSPESLRLAAVYNKAVLAWVDARREIRLKKI